MKLAKITAALGFAHLLGLPAAAAARVDGDKDDKKDEQDPGADDGDDDEDAKADESDKDDKKDAKAGADDGQEPDDEKDEKAKSKAGADDGDDEDDSDKEKAARKSERARCAAIFASPSAGSRPDMAAHLAFNTGMSSKAAVGMLDAIAAGSGAAPRGLASRMAGTSIPNVGASAPAGKQATGAAGAAQMIIDAGKKRRGEK